MIILNSRKTLYLFKLRKGHLFSRCNLLRICLEEISQFNGWVVSGVQYSDEGTNFIFSKIVSKFLITKI